MLCDFTLFSLSTYFRYDILQAMPQMVSPNTSHHRIFQHYHRVHNQVGQPLVCVLLTHNRIHKAGQNNGALCGAMYAARDWPYCRPEYSCRYGRGHTSRIRDSGNTHKAWSHWNCRGRSRLHFCTQQDCRSRGTACPEQTPFFSSFYSSFNITSEKNKKPEELR